jgi:hypothetical protein
MFGVYVVRNPREYLQNCTQVSCRLQMASSGKSETPALLKLARSGSNHNMNQKGPETPSPSRRRAHTAGETETLTVLPASRPVVSSLNLSQQKSPAVLPDLGSTLTRQTSKSGRKRFREGSLPFLWDFPEPSVCSWFSGSLTSSPHVHSAGNGSSVSVNGTWPLTSTAPRSPHCTCWLL